MKARRVYIDLDGQAIALEGLDAEERRLLNRVQKRSQTHPDWNDFDNFWMAAVVGFYDARGISRAEISNKPIYRIAQDLSGRLGIAQGTIRPPDHLEQLEDLVLNHFPSRRAFCRASGISAKLLDDVLAGRKDLSLEALAKALGGIGYRLSILPTEKTKQPA